jgi:hypothetical protein
VACHDADLLGVDWPRPSDHAWAVLDKRPDLHNPDLCAPRGPFRDRQGQVAPWLAGRAHRGPDDLSCPDRDHDGHVADP